MFRSKKRPIIIPQREHARLAGMLAEMWGNEKFDLPAIPFHSFLAGVALHDSGYEPFDTAPIPDVDEESWLLAQRKGAELELCDVTADILVKLHVKRLVSFKQTPARIACAEDFERGIQQRLTQCPFSRAQLEWCDRITHFCDNLAFDFCFEEEKQGVVSLCPRWDSEETVEVRYEIKAEGQVGVTPWPFKSSGFHRFLIAYDAQSYPEKKRPTLMPAIFAPA